jgi:hypothetical protein
MQGLSWLERTSALKMLAKWYQPTPIVDQTWSTVWTNTGFSKRGDSVPMYSLGYYGEVDKKEIEAFGNSTLMFAKKASNPNLLKEIL